MMLLFFMTFVHLFLSYAPYLKIENPVNATLYNGNTVYIGSVSPGGSFYIVASANTTNYTGYKVNIGWNEFEAKSLPNGWFSAPTSLYSNPMKLRITVGNNTSYGIYNITLEAINVGNYSRIGNITIHALVNVSSKVFNISVEKNVVDSRIGIPANVVVKIRNNGMADEPFVIYSRSLPSFQKNLTVVSISNSTGTFNYTVEEYYNGVYNFTLFVNGTFSPYVRKSFREVLFIEPSFETDIASFGYGIPIFPPYFTPIYALIYLIQKILR
ncbi:MAG: hypothetical protein QXL16_01900 [Candidatus Micrarchaeaceae archaeon]